MQTTKLCLIITIVACVPQTQTDRPEPCSVEQAKAAQAELQRMTAEPLTAIQSEAVQAATQESVGLFNRQNYCGVIAVTKRFKDTP